MATRPSTLPLVRSMLPPKMHMTTTLVVVGAIWMALSLVFCLALCVAAAKPRPDIADGEDLVAPLHETTQAVGEDGLCAGKS